MLHDLAEQSLGVVSCLVQRPITPDDGRMQALDEVCRGRSEGRMLGSEPVDLR
jgi:hypothetical protein